MAEEKSLILALILSFLFCVGNVSNGLTTRGIVSLVIYIVLYILTLLTGIAGILLLIYWVYILYDTYVCNQAVNDGTEIPLFLFFLDLE